MYFAAAICAAVFHTDFCIDPFAYGVAGCASSQKAEQGAGQGSNARSGCCAEYGNARADGGPGCCAGTESGIGAPGSDCSSDKGSGFFRDSVSDHEFVCIAAWAGWYEFFHEHFLDG